MPEQQVKRLAGGELISAEEETAGTVVALRNTTLEPDQVAADASRNRLDLAKQAGALELAIYVADTIEARDSLERMLSHQLAAVHSSAMKMNGQLNRMLDRADQTDGSLMQTANVEACRLAGAVSRMTNTFQQGLFALQKHRSGGNQTVTVQHVHVGNGGQAVVAGKLGDGGRSRSRKGGDAPK